MQIHCRLSLPLFFCLILIFLHGCAGSAPSERDKIRAQEEASQNAHEEMQKSFESDSLQSDLEQDSAQKESTSQPDAQGLPSWVTSPPSSNKYIYGVGSAEIHTNPALAMDQAKDRARTGILKRMEVTVNGETRTSVKRQVEKGQSRVTRSVLDRVRTEVPRTKLRHVEQVDSYVDREKETVFALLRLDREEAKDELASRINEVDHRLRNISKRETSGSRLERLETLVPALPLLEKRQEMVVKLRRLGSLESDYRLPSDLRGLRNRITDLLDSLVFVLEPRNRESEKLASGLREALTSQGLRARQRGRGDLFLHYEIDLRPKERDGIHFVFARGSVTVLNGQGNIIDEFRKKAKAASQDPQLARDRTVDKLADGLGQKLAASLIKALSRDLLEPLSDRG